MHLEYLRETYNLNVERTKNDMPCRALFTQADVDLFNSNVALGNAVQPTISRRAIVDKWKSVPILYPQEPKDTGNSKYCHLVLYNGFTSDLKAELRRIFGSEAKIDQHVAHMRSLFEIGGQRKSGRCPKHQTPSRFPEKSYWPSPIACLPSPKLAPMKNIPPAKVTPSVLDPPLPSKKQYFEDQQENRKASTSHQGMFSAENEGGVSNLSRAIGSITIEKENLLGATPVPAPVGGTPAVAQGGTGL